MDNDSIVAPHPEDIVLAVDIGGSKYMIGLVDRSGNIISVNRYDWRLTSIEELLPKIISAINDTIKQNPIYEIQAIGMTIPGLVELSSGSWISFSASGIKKIPLVEIIRKRIKQPVYIENDARASALAEKKYGPSKDCDNFLYLTVSTGVAGAFVFNGEVYHGGNDNAGEIGQCIVVEGGRVAESGERGTLEAYASTYGLVTNYVEAGGKNSINGEKLNGKIISDLAAKGDPAALRAFEIQGYYLGKVIASTLNMLSLEKVIIGGGMSLASKFFMPKLKETIKQDYYIRYEPVIIEATELGYNGAFLGAAAFAFLNMD